MGLLFNIANVCAGLLLGASALDKVDGESNIFNKAANFLAPFNLIIGGACAGLGILSLIKGGGILYNAVSICSGLLLLTAVLAKTPLVGDLLVKVAAKLAPFKVTIGIASLVIGALNIVGIRLF
ncbi:MAG: hypothetical protein AB8B61_00445 [Cyclobacteriaceae bacterium]